MSDREALIASRAAAEKAARATLAVEVFDELSNAVLPAVRNIIAIAKGSDDDKLVLAASQKILAEWKELARKPIDDAEMRRLSASIRNMGVEQDALGDIAADPEKAGEFLARLGKDGVGNA